ncbi:MAG: hypothetical protein MI754_03655 [Chromatiales bacterium]|nr:hypothetical protein [Chromatiales bacterium]
MKFSNRIASRSFAPTLVAGIALFSLHSTAHADSYNITVTNHMDKELLAPVLVAPVSADPNIFKKQYVTQEAETQILTGDPAKLAERIGNDVTVAHGNDGPPGVLLAPGKSISFKVKTKASAVRLISMVAPTKVPDNFVTGIINLKAPVDITLERYDIGHNEGNKEISHVSTGSATVKISRSMGM